MKKILTVIFLVFLLGCTDAKEKEPKVCYKYTIWVGSSVIAWGRGVNNYEIDGDIVSYPNNKGGKTITPLSNVTSIDENNCFKE